MISSLVTPHQDYLKKLSTSWESKDVPWRSLREMRLTVSVTTRPRVTTGGRTSGGRSMKTVCRQRLEGTSFAPAEDRTPAVPSVVRRVQGRAPCRCIISASAKSFTNLLTFILHPNFMAHDITNHTVLLLTVEAKHYGQAEIQDPLHSRGNIGINSTFYGILYFVYKRYSTIFIAEVKCSFEQLARLEWTCL
jgi:hypothetical protein